MSGFPFFAPGAADLETRAAALADRLTDGLKPLARVAYNYAWSWLPDGERRVPGHQPAPLGPLGRQPGAVPRRPLAAHAGARGAEPGAARADPGARRRRSRPTWRGRTATGPASTGRRVLLRRVRLPRLAARSTRAASACSPATSSRRRATRRCRWSASGCSTAAATSGSGSTSAGRQHEYWVRDRPEEPADGARHERRTARRCGSTVTLSGAPLDVPGLARGRRPGAAAAARRRDPGERRGAALDDGAAVRGQPRRSGWRSTACSGSAARACSRRSAIEPAVIHLNEGHPALAPLELAAARVAAGTPFEEALAEVRERVVFTTHTPVPAGNETYRREEFLGAFGDLPRGSASTTRRSSRSAASIRPTRRSGPGMTPLAMRVSEPAQRRQPAPRRGGARDVAAAVRGRRRRRRADRARHERRAPADVPRRADARAARRGISASGWLRAPADRRRWEAVRGHPERGALGRRAARRGGGSSSTSAVKTEVRPAAPRRADRGGARGRRSLEDDALTLGFARRLATYKRLHLLTHDPDRVRRILAGAQPGAAPDRGQGAPERRGAARDAAADLPAPPATAARAPSGSSSSRTTTSRIARQLVSGCDVWVNLPRRPMEASGTSGMKATFNGGAPAERARRLVGRGLRRRATAGRSPATRPATTTPTPTRFYDLLEHEVIPLFYDRDADGVPQRWCEKVKDALVTCGAGRSPRRACCATTPSGCTRGGWAWRKCRRGEACLGLRTILRWTSQRTTPSFSLPCSSLVRALLVLAPSSGCRTRSCSCSGGSGSGSSPASPTSSCDRTSCSSRSCRRCSTRPRSSRRCGSCAEHAGDLAARGRARARHTVGVALGRPRHHLRPVLAGCVRARRHRLPHRPGRRDGDRSRLGVPRRVVTIVEGESLINDATALVAYSFAVAAVVDGQLLALARGRALRRRRRSAAAIGLAVGCVISPDAAPARPLADRDHDRPLHRLLRLPAGRGARCLGACSPPSRSASTSAGTRRS